LVIFRLVLCASAEETLRTAQTNNPAAIAAWWIN
jgi:hypothetical protein